MTPEECDVEPGIVTVSNIGRPMAKSLAMTGASSALLRLEMHDTSTLGSERALGAGGAGMGSLARCYRTSHLSELILNSALSSAGQAAASMGELNYVNYWPTLTPTVAKSLTEW
jgi:hypothetical protein